MELKVSNVSKKYNDKIAINNLNIVLNKGVIGLVGANGAGKSTLMRMLCGILKPSCGSIDYEGIDVKEEKYRDILGYLPQDFGYYPEFTALDFMMYISSLKGIDKKQAKNKSLELLDKVGLIEVKNKKIKTFSGGMKQRLGIAQALLNDPKVIILDEPTAGLDPKERVRFRNMIKELGEDNIVLLSTHIVSDIEKIADRILVIKDGKIVFDGTEKDTGDDLEKFYLNIFGDEENA